MILRSQLRRLLVALATLASAMGALQADEVTEAARMADWHDHALEMCAPADAAFRVFIVIDSDWMDRRVIRMPLRMYTPDPTEVKAGTVMMDPVVLLPRTAPTAPQIIAEISRATYRSFVVRITVHEGGPELALSRFDDKFICTWQAKQDFEEDGVTVRVFIELGPETPASIDPTVERPPPPEPARKRRVWPFGRREETPEPAQP